LRAVVGGSALTIGAATTTRGTPGRFAHVFITREFAVAIFIQRLEGGAGVGDFIGVNDAVVVGVQGRDDGRHRAMSTGASRATMTTLSARAAAGPVLGRGAGVLRVGGE